MRKRVVAQATIYPMHHCSLQLHGHSVRTTNGIKESRAENSSANAQRLASVPFFTEDETVVQRGEVGLCCRVL